MKQADAIRRYVLEGIGTGLFPEGARLPSAQELARRKCCSTHAVRRAFRQLSDAGILASKTKIGTRVLRRPALGRALFMRAADPHTNFLLQDAVEHALINAGLDAEFLPWLFQEGNAFASLRHLARKDAADTILVSLAQELVPAPMRPAWEEFAAGFQYRVGFQFEDGPLLADSVTVLSDPVVAARLVAEHLLALGHRRIGVVAGGRLAEGSAAARRAAALTEFLTVAGAECFPFQYGLHAEEGVTAFVKRTGCTAWWTTSDHQAIDHMLVLQRAGFRVPEDLSVIGTNDTPWATTSGLSLTTLSLDPAGIAQAIAEAVRAAAASRADELDGRQPAKHYIRPRLVSRSSSAAPTGAPPNGSPVYRQR